MRKIYLSLLITLFVSGVSFAQTVLFSDNFTTYDSLSGANYNGWNLSYYGFSSYYTSTQSAGPSGPHSYKFGRDSATAITPAFANTADSIHFWMKGNTATGGTMAQSAFYIYESPDGSTWNPVVAMMPPLPVTGTMMHYPLTAGTVQVKFFYDKDTGNVAFDDFSVTTSIVGVREVNLEKQIKLFPTPASSKLTVNFGSVMNSASMVMINVIGKEVMKASMTTPDDIFTMNVSGLEEGIYFLKIKADNNTVTRRIIVRH